MGRCSWPDIFDRLLPLLTLVLGAFATYWFTLRRESKEREARRRDDIEGLAGALRAELANIAEGLEGRVSSIDRLLASGRTGGSEFNTSCLSELYKANLGRIGLLGARAAQKVVRAYTSIPFLPRRIILKKDAPAPNWPAQDPQIFECAPSYPGLASLLDQHRLMLRWVREAIEELERHETTVPRMELVPVSG